MSHEGHPPAPVVRGVHHSAFRCRDAEETRRFYEDVLGLRTRATLTFDVDPGGRPRPYMHLFFEMADGNFIAFFDLPHTVDPKKFRPKDGMEHFHVAMEVGSRDDLAAFKARLESFSIPVFGPIDHHFCHSIYFWDPNGIALEFTARDERHDAILDEEQRASKAVMQKWMTETKAVRERRWAELASPEKAAE